MSDGIFDRPMGTSYIENDLEVSFDEFRKVVETRRSVRVYKKDAVPDSVVNECLRLALLAPNSSNLQPWEFHWVKSADKKDGLVEACFGQPAAKTAPTLIVCVARTGTWRRNAKIMLEQLKKNRSAPKALLTYYGKLVPSVYTMGLFNVIGLARAVVMFFAGLFRPSLREPNTMAGLRTWAAKSTALACENLMLAFRAAGYDSCPMEGIDSRRIKKLLGLPWDARVIMVISAGKRADNGVYGERVRLDRRLFIKTH